MFKSEAEWRQELEALGALVFRDQSEPTRPHFLLTSNNHSGGFCNCERLFEQPVIFTAAASDLMEQLRSIGVTEADFDCVVGPAMGAITLAHEIARHFSLSSKTTKSIFRAYVEKDPEDSERMIFTRTTISPGTRVLLVEDVLTTGRSVEKTARAVDEAGGMVLPFVAAIVNRSGQRSLYNRKVVALVTNAIETWIPADCPLCKEGSEAIRPKGPGNWARLTGRSE